MNQRTILSAPAAACFIAALLALPASATSAGEPPETSGSSDFSRADISGNLTDTIVSLEKRSWEAWKNRDAKFFESFLSDDHVDVHGGGPVGKAAVVAGVGSPACVVRSYSIERFQLTKINDDTALLVYRAEQDTSCGGARVPSPTWITSLYVRRGGRWWNACFVMTPTTGGK